MSLKTDLPSRFLYLDSIRALAAIYVVMHHISLMYLGFSPTNLTGLRSLFIKSFSYGHLSVDWFIVLSGFSLMLAVVKNNDILKGGTLLFFKRRITRIIPPYYATLFLCLIMIWLFIGNDTGTLWDNCIHITYFDVLSHIIMLHDFFSSTASSISYSLWSISVEFRIYLLFPLLVWIWRKKGFFFTLGFSVSFVVVGTILLIYAKDHYSEVSLISSGVCPYLILFTLGMLTAEVCFSQSRMAISVRNIYNKLSLRIIIIFLTIYVIIYQSASILIKSTNSNSEVAFFITQQIKDILVGVFAAFFLFTCSLTNSSDKNIFWVFKVLRWQPLVFIGTFSYSLYLIHPLLIQLISQYVLKPFQFSNMVNTYILLVIGTPLIVAASYLFFLLFERPFLKSGTKNIKAIAINTINEPAP